MISPVKEGLRLDLPPPVPVKKVDPPPVGDSPDIHTGKSTAMITPPMHEYGLKASAGGNDVTIQLTKHSLGINVDAKA